MCLNVAWDRHRPRRSCSAFEQLLQLLLVSWQLSPRLWPDDERNKQPTDPSTLEVECNRHARAFPVVEGFDRRSRRSKIYPPALSSGHVLRAITPGVAL